MSKKPKKQKHAKVSTRQYISNTDEPKDNLSYDSLAKDETILVGNSSPMKQRFRDVAQKIRRIKNIDR
jgi:hypothetical protein